MGKGVDKMSTKPRPGTEPDDVRVLFLSDHFGYDGGVIHGATRYFLTVLPKLSERGVDLSVAFLRGDHPASNRLEKIKPTFFGRGKWNPMTVLDVYRMVRRKRIQVIHAAGMKGILTARIAGKMAGVPVISHLHDHMPIASVLFKLVSMTPGLSAYTLAVSSEVSEYARTDLNIAPNRLETLTSGMELDTIAGTPAEAGTAFRRQFGIPEDATVIGILGRFIPAKGHDVLLRAMPGILEQEPNARVMIVGDGPERADLEKRVHELELRGYVFFTGYTSEAYAAIKAMDVCAIPSLSEGLPFVLLESLALCRPVVASAVGGLAETLIHCENGVLVRPGDAQALAQALLSVMSDESLRKTIIQNGYQTVKRFDVSEHVTRLVTIYRALAGGLPVPIREFVAHKHAESLRVDQVPESGGVLQRPD